MKDWWERNLQEVTAGQLCLIVVPTHPYSSNDDFRIPIAGAVILRKKDDHTSTSKGIVENLLLSPEWSQRGLRMQVAWALIGKVEHTARGHGFMILVSVCLSV